MASLEDEALHNGYLRWIEGAKHSETRSARIAEMLSLLKAGKKQR